MKKTYNFVGVLALGVMLTLNSCKKDVSPVAERVSYAEVIQSGGDFTDFQNHKILTNITNSSIPVDSGNWNCTNSTWNVLQGNTDFPIYDPNVSVVYPGSLIQGASLNSATPDVIAVRRGEGTVSIDIVNGSAAVAVPIAEIKKSAISQALNDIMANNNHIMPARFTLKHEVVKTQEELALGLGLNFSAWGATVAANLGFAHNTNATHYLVSLKQTFYTMSFDIPYDYNSLFHPTVKPMDLAKYVGPGNPACYISDVTYGRVFYLLIESTSSSDSIAAAITASYNTDTINGTINASYLSSLQNLNVKVMSLGGDVTSTFSTIDVTDLPTLTSMLGQSANIQTGVPLSYVVRTVYNNRLVKNKIDMEYTVNDCHLVP
jgi:thiol-activated cytolysin